VAGPACSVLGSRNTTPVRSQILWKLAKSHGVCKGAVAILRTSFYLLPYGASGDVSTELKVLFVLPMCFSICYPPQARSKTRMSTTRTLYDPRSNHMDAVRFMDGVSGHPNCKTLLRYPRESLGSPVRCIQMCTYYLFSVNLCQYIYIYIYIYIYTYIYIYIYIYINTYMFINYPFVFQSK
jgi:hypothetical protein